MTGDQTKLDAPFSADAELDALYERASVTALRISREPHRLEQQLEAGTGDLELVALEGLLLRVRLKCACGGYPRATLDLKQVVGRLVRNRYPQIREVRNTL